MIQPFRVVVAWYCITLPHRDAVAVVQLHMWFLNQLRGVAMVMILTHLPNDAAIAEVLIILFLKQQPVVVMALILIPQLKDVVFVVVSTI